MTTIFKTALRTVALAGVLAATLTGAQAAPTGLLITEWMYNPGTAATGEFVEFTNFGTTAINMSGWSFDDNSRVAGSESLAAFGTIAAGESVIFTDSTAAAFRSAWNLGAGVKIIGGNLNNLGRSDEINLYNGSTLVDRLTYNDQGTGAVAGPRTAGISGEAKSVATFGANNATLWKLAVVGDTEHARLSAFGDIGSPGTTAFASVSAVPEPQSYAMLLAGLALFGVAGLRRKQDNAQ